MSFLVNWNELFLACVASSNLGPTVTARAMQTAHTAIFDTWAAFDPTAIGVHSRLEADEALLTPDAYDDALEEAIAKGAVGICFIFARGPGFAAAVTFGFVGTGEC